MEEAEVRNSRSKKLWAVCIYCLPTMYYYYYYYYYYYLSTKYLPTTDMTVYLLPAICYAGSGSR